MASGHSLPQVNLGVQGGTQGSSHTSYRTCMPQCPIVSHRVFALERVQQGIKSSVLLPFSLNDSLPQINLGVQGGTHRGPHSGAQRGALISLISDNGPQFISKAFEHLSHRLDIKYIKTVTYRPQANLTEIVNRALVQMIACFVEKNHDNWDRFLHEFSFALRTSVNEMTGKTPAELFLGRKIITPYSKLINVTESAEYVGGNMEKFFDETRKRSLQGSEHEDQKRSTPIPTQGIKRTVPSSVSSRKHKYRRPNNLFQGPQSIAGPSHQLDARQCKPPTEGSRQGASVQYSRDRESRTAPSKGNSAAERRPVRSRQSDSSETLSLLPTQLIKEARRNTRGAMGSTVYRRTTSREGDSAWKP
ncbi:uncharacterized protein TNCV_4323691 [Trichonephila clavipes]|nr:uncharacterized protein TNCV_4323691 [Trichonephila clavipes]